VSNKDIGKIKSPLDSLQIRGGKGCLKMEKFDQREVYTQYCGYTTKMEGYATLYEMLDTTIKDVKKHD